MKVRTPVEGFTGTVAGVEFADGVGETDDPNALSYFRRHGYGVGSKPVVEPVKGDAQTGADQGEGDATGEATKPAPAKKAAAAKKAAPKKPAKKAAAKPASTK